MGKYRELALQTCRDLELRRREKELINLKVQEDLRDMVYTRKARYIRKKSKRIY